jgi:hypothetical protein
MLVACYSPPAARVCWLLPATLLATSSRGEALDCRRRIASILGGLFHLVTSITLALSPAVILPIMLTLNGPNDWPEAIALRQALLALRIVTRNLLQNLGEPFVLFLLLRGRRVILLPFFDRAFHPFGLIACRRRSRCDEVRNGDDQR